ncbi:unnamed protein product, partial [Phaeothamnion confervicola]
MAPSLARDAFRRKRGDGGGGEDESSPTMVDGSRVAALGSHRGQVACLSVDEWGSLLVSGDEDGLICCSLLQRWPGSSDNDD